MRLQKCSQQLPSGGLELLQELGTGESGFGGTSFGRGEASIEQFLTECLAGEREDGVPAGFVPQSIFWILSDQAAAIGLMRLRPQLNERLLQSGGHVGFYVRRSARRTGVATAALAHAVELLHQRGVVRVLVTAGIGNAGSNRVILRNGGIYDGQGESADGETVNRYWIEPA